MNPLGSFTIKKGGEKLARATDIAIFVDGENLRYMLKDIGLKANLKSLVEAISLNIGGHFSYGIFVAIDRGKSIDSGLSEGVNNGLSDVAKYSSSFNSFQNHTAKLGFKIITKSTKKIQTCDSDYLKFKSGGDVEIAVEMTSFIIQNLKLKNKPSIVLVSGDSDYEYLIKRALGMGYDVWVIATQNALSRELLRAVGGNRIIYLEKIKEFIRR